MFKITYKSLWYREYSQYFFLYWSTVNLQCWVSFKYTAKWFSYKYIHIHIYTHTHTLFHILFPYRLLLYIEYSSLCYKTEPCCLSISNILVSVVEKAMAPHSSTLAWKIPWMEEPGRLQSMGSLRVGHNWVTSLSLFTFMLWGKK